MNIILKHIPPSTFSAQIKAFLKPVMAGGFLCRKGNIEQIEIFQSIITAPRGTEYYALVCIEPDSVAERVIGKLNRKKLNGKFVEIAQYHDRHWSNERRMSGVQIDTSLHGRRRGERRRKQTRIELGKLEAEF